MSAFGTFKKPNTEISCIKKTHKNKMEIMIFEPILTIHTEIWVVITFGGTFWEKLSSCHKIFYNKKLSNTLTGDFKKNLFSLITLKSHVKTIISVPPFRKPLCYLSNSKVNWFTFVLLFYFPCLPNGGGANEQWTKGRRQKGEQKKRLE